MGQIEPLEVCLPDGWQTSATFQAEIYSGDFDRYDRAFRRFVDTNIDRMLASARQHVPAARVEEVVQETLLKLHRQIWEKGWTHPPGTRFRQCVNQLAKDVTVDSLRNLSRRQRVGDGAELDEASAANLKEECATWIDGFMRQEILTKAEAAVQLTVTASQWELYFAWKEKSGFSVVNQQHWNDESVTPFSGSERTALARIRQQIRAEIESLANREGWSINELM